MEQFLEGTIQKRQQNSCSFLRFHEVWKNFRATNYDRRALRLAVGLSCLAGYVDASGFLGTGGLFVSFMSGNSTKLSIAAAEGRWRAMGLILGLIGLFVLAWCSDR
jgi:hypothetical protein